jgi:cobyrinic acid a,c-diamide synthase
VENCKGQSLTLAARIKGILEFRSNNIRAVLLNNAGEDFFKTLKPVIERETGLPVVGFLPHVSDCTIESRHLGLVTAEEIEDLRGKIGRLADTIEKTVDINALLSIAASAPPLKTPPASKGVFTVKTRYRKRVRIGVARDKAFCFYYDDGLVLLKEMGAELLDFSPLSAEKLPSGLDGLILGGGYPELYAAELSANKTMLAAIKSAVDGGIPTIAECGGFMYLHREVECVDGVLYPLAAVIDARCENKRRLVRFGYAEFTANADNLLCSEGGVLRGHEFHYWDSDCPGDAFTAVKPVSGKSWKCAIASEILLAGFPHFHFCSAPETAERFLTICRA